MNQIPDNILLVAINGMQDAPSSLAKRIGGAAYAEDLELPVDLAPILDRLIAVNDANDPLRLRLISLVAAWDAALDVDWCAGTKPHTLDRRAVIHQRLGWTETYVAAWDRLQPVARIRPPTIIADEHVDWYDEGRRQLRSFYWSAYKEHLLHTGWADDSVWQLDADSNAVVAGLANPEQIKAYAARGLVVGYVQSGKTANFTAVIAKAADAGYRLVIVLAGVLDILREQTQRRLDKELVGWELCGYDEGEYKDATEEQRAEFVHHGMLPSEQGAFDWDRLTGAKTDYKALNYGVGALRFARRDTARPLFDPVNLHATRARIVVVKKNKDVLTTLARDLRAFKEDLAEVPALIIDDESDQAGLNTAAEGKTVTAINQCIRNILSLLPRGQYVGYTATPFANVFINPHDPGDLFPKDFIVCLQRPVGYVGLREFFGIDIDDEGELDDLKEVIRAETSAPLIFPIIGGDEGDENLRRAVDLYVLTGAIKLYRAANTAIEEPPLQFKHHTMLVHSSQLQVDHEYDRRLVLKIWDESRYHAVSGLSRLEVLWNEQIRPTTAVRGQGLPMPPKFEDLVPFISECKARIEERVGNADSFVLIVNGNDAVATTPNFERDPIWKILVGGNKLSRGYTVEGLTISYYRRPTGTADTLMQMGRWFGFRRGYPDLVRLFAAREVRKGKQKARDLIEDFIEVCWMEEELRRDLRKYSKGEPPLRPDEVRPLVRYTERLLPTARNRMRNAEVVGKNFSLGRATPTQAPEGETANAHNVKLVKKLFKTTTATSHEFTMPGEGGHLEMIHASARSEAVESFLKELKWSRDHAIDDVLKFLARGSAVTAIDRWHLVCFNVNSDTGDPVETGWPQVPPVNVVARARKGRYRFGVYSDPKHRRIAAAIVGQNDGNPGWPRSVANLRDTRSACMLMYFVRERQSDDTIGQTVHVGFELFFPKNDVKERLFYRARSGEES